MVPGFVPLAVGTCLDVFRDVSVHPGPPEVLPHKHNCFLLSEVLGHFAVLFGFENGGNNLLGNVEASAIVEYIS